MLEVHPHLHMAKTPAVATKSLTMGILEENPRSNTRSFCEPTISSKIVTLLSPEIALTPRSAGKLAGNKHAGRLDPVPGHYQRQALPPP